MEFVRVCSVGDVAPSTCSEFRAGGRIVLICEEEGAYFAHSATCPHQDSSLDGARLCGGAIECPWHHYTFDVVSGECEYPDEVAALETYSLERRGDDIYVRFT